MMLTDTHVVGRSSNAKIGKIAATYRPQSTCPNTCVFHPDQHGGCYATGRINGMAKKYATTISIADAAKKILGATLLRDRVVGDVATNDGSVDYDYITNVAAIGKLANVPVFSYTHMWDGMDVNKIPANYVMNASTETVEQASHAIDLGFPVVITNDNMADGTQINGKRVITCPAQTRDNVTCQTCKLCARGRDRKYIVRFLIHGIAKNKARKAVTQ